jgi:PAS domain S-box-containing protein
MPQSTLTAFKPPDEVYRMVEDLKSSWRVWARAEDCVGAASSAGMPSVTLKQPDYVTCLDLGRGLPSSRKAAARGEGRRCRGAGPKRIIGANHQHGMELPHSRGQGAHAHDPGFLGGLFASRIDCTNGFPGNFSRREAMDGSQAKEAEDRIQLIIDTVPALIWTAGSDGRLDFVSQRLLDYAGVTPEQLQGWDWTAQCHPDEVEQFVTKWRTAVADGEAFEAEVRIRSVDGEYRWFLCRASPLFDPSGDILGWYGNNIDIHERKRAEEALQQAQADLARVSRVTTMAELTASVAHEVNQPITAALTNASACLRWLAGKAPDLEEARAAAMRILQDGTRAAEIIAGIRQLFEKGTQERKLVDLNEVIRELVVLLRSEAARYAISIRTELASDLPSVMGDRVQLQQVMMNLIINSIDATKDVEGTRELTIKSQRTDDEEVTVSVSDTGVGLPAQQADQIFNAFFTTKPHGTGMGLSISRSIIESHGGRLWAEDNTPNGASLHFALPVS